MELLREIILCLGSTSTHAACKLRLVSRNFNVWVLPLLFRTVTFTTPDHVTRFAATLLPKRKVHIPAMKSTLHTLPRPLSSYAITSLAFVVHTRLPSVEIGLASVAPAFTQVKNLVVTARNLSSNAHWIRHHPIRPRYMMVVHFGFPHLFNYREPIFESVTHLYTSVLTGLRGTSVADLPCLTHLAVHTRGGISSFSAWGVANQIAKILGTLPRLKRFVLVLGDPPADEAQLEEWKELLGSCMHDKRFSLLPFFRELRREWQDIVEGRESVWDRADAWRSLENETSARKLSYLAALVDGQYPVPSALQKKPQEPEWEIDLVQRVDYSPYEGDPAEKGDFADLLLI